MSKPDGDQVNATEANRGMPLRSRADPSGKFPTSDSTRPIYTNFIELSAAMPGSITKPPPATRYC